MSKKVKAPTEQTEEIMSYETKAVSPLTDPAHEFDGNKLGMKSDGFYRYLCDDINKVSKSLFHCTAAKNYGLRKGDIVYVTDSEEIKLILV